MWYVINRYETTMTYPYILTCIHAFRITTDTDRLLHNQITNITSQEYHISHLLNTVLCITSIARLTSLKKSPTHLATMSTIMRGRPNVMLPTHSMRMTVRLRVMRTTPPNMAPAPTSAYFPSSTQSWMKAEGWIIVGNGTLKEIPTKL